MVFLLLKLHILARCKRCHADLNIPTFVAQSRGHRYRVGVSYHRSAPQEHVAAALGARSGQETPKAAAVLRWSPLPLALKSCAMTPPASQHLPHLFYNGGPNCRGHDYRDSRMLRCLSNCPIHPKLVLLCAYLILCWASKPYHRLCHVLRPPGHRPGYHPF